jgi:hypothetical protein
MATEYKQGNFHPKFPHKYKGNIQNIIYRSGWEKRFMEWCDENSTIVEWSSEEVIIPYRSPMDGRIHRYFPDFVIKARKPDGTLKEMLIEIKPHAQTVAPSSSRKTKKFLQEVVTYGINQAKWDAAKNYCADKGWEFAVITEKQFGFSNGNKHK